MLVFLMKYTHSKDMSHEKKALPIAIIALCTLPLSANAALFKTQSSIIDTDSNIEYLRTDLTKGMDFCDIQARFNAGGDNYCSSNGAYTAKDTSFLNGFDEWRIGTRSEIVSLFAAYGLPFNVYRDYSGQDVTVHASNPAARKIIPLMEDVANIMRSNDPRFFEADASTKGLIYYQEDGNSNYSLTRFFNPSSDTTRWAMLNTDLSYTSSSSKFTPNRTAGDELYTTYLTRDYNPEDYEAININYDSEGNVTGLSSSVEVNAPTATGFMVLGLGMILMRRGVA